MRPKGKRAWTLLLLLVVGQKKVSRIGGRGDSDVESAGEFAEEVEEDWAGLVKSTVAEPNAPAAERLRQGDEAAAVVVVVAREDEEAVRVKVSGLIDPNSVTASNR